jgi:cyclopropane fatty-acyl-phospholipid synthase-like methyltransferase
LGVEAHLYHSNSEVISWYESKTESIIEKYGSGPKIHFHTGYFDDGENPSKNEFELRRQLIRSQEKLLKNAFRFWDKESTVGSSVLDVGCGLGGTSIFLAKKYDMNVIALTNVPTHAKLTEEYVKEACVSDKVKVALGDACQYSGELILDSAIALESSCYLERYEWFRRLSKILKKGGHVYISDCFTPSINIAKPFNEYWLTRVGSLNEYLEAAEKGGFELETFKDLTSHTVDFWRFNIAYQAMRLKKTKSVKESERLQKSIEWQQNLHRIWGGGRIQYGLLSFRFK